MARRARQLQITGTERSPENPEFEELCEDLRILRAERIATQSKEQEALAKLLAYRPTMGNPPDVYRYPDVDGTSRVAKFKPTVKVSIRSEKSADDDDDDDGGDGDDRDDGGVAVQ